MLFDIYLCAGGREKSSMQRRSWHADRVTARLLSTVSPSNSLTHLPHFIRSISIDSSSNTSGENSSSVAQWLDQ